MKNFITLINLCIIVVVTTIFTPSRNSSDKRNAFKNNEQTASAEVWTASTPALKPYTASARTLERKISLSKRDETFLITAAERMLSNIDIARLAEQRGTTRAIKSYGETLVKDQSEILVELKKLAALKSMDFPTNIRDSEATNDIKEIHGKSFDRKFIKMMLFDQKKYARDFERAAQSNDPDIQVFATKYLPVIQSHLIQIKSMKKPFGF